MAFASTVSGNSIHGNHRVVWGTFTNTDTDSGGSIDTGFDTIFGFMVIPTSHSGVLAPKYSASGGTVTLVTGNGVDGNWYAVGL